MDGFSVLIKKASKGALLLLSSVRRVNDESEIDSHQTLNLPKLDFELPSLQNCKRQMTVA